MNFSIDGIPLWSVFAITVAVVLLSVRMGFFLGLRKRRRNDGASDSPIGSVVGAMLGLLAFILAFTFGTASSRFDTRKQLLLDEVNAIGTAYLRAEIIPEPHRAECRSLLRRYVDIRVRPFDNQQVFVSSVAESEDVQRDLWSHAVAFGRADMHSDMGTLFVESLNAVFDLHTSRLTVARRYRIPGVLWITLMAVTTFSMTAVGYQFGLAGGNNLLIQGSLAIVFASVVVLIADLDRASGGALRVSQQPMMELQKQMSSAPK